MRNVLHDLCGVQAQFLSNALHCLRIRSRDFSEDALPDLVKSWTIRGTMHVFLKEDLPLFLHQDRKHNLRPCDTMDADDRISENRKRYFADVILDCIDAGMHAREELKQVCFERGMTEREAESVFNPWGGTLRALCENGVICHAVQEKKAFVRCPDFVPMEREAARMELARRYFSCFAPATVRDAAYFFGTTQAEVKSWLEKLPVEAVECEGRTYFYIDHGETCTAEIPQCIFLAGFDQLLLGYEKTESLFLPQEHLRKIFNLAGIVMPTVLLRGRIVGKWKKQGTKLNVALFENLSATDRNCIESCARQTWNDLKRVNLDD